MNENENISAVPTEDVENKDTPEQEQTETELAASESAEDALSHPMFAHFAKGKRGNIEDICRDFKNMLSAMPKNDIHNITAKMTPSVSANAAPDLALTERQRMIARAAGMSYREYYTLVNDIPARRGKH
ncbi:MAG: hypothetical protein IJ489_06845 [Clostridia bacterium]|nr:hypothetical protein [Clostridia bacterium]